ncbi:MAG: Clp1/GlmU family protein [Actinomycetota bacterium]
MERVSHEEILQRIVARGGTIVLLGGIDTGKTTFALDLAEAARSRGLSTAYIDADLGQTTVGPPTCIGLKYVGDLERVERQTVSHADQLAFVGSTSPSGHLLPVLSGTGRMVTHARETGCEVIIVDSSGLISGVYAELLKYHKLQLVRPDAVVGFQRGAELDPILGIVRRFLPADVTALRVRPEVRERSAEERLAYREEQFGTYFGAPLQRWRVKTTVFMPALPPDLELARLDGLVVGLEDGKGNCLGVGLLEYDPVEGILRMVSPISEGATGLLVGSMRITTDGKLLGRITARELFGSE